MEPHLGFKYHMYESACNACTVRKQLSTMLVKGHVGFRYYMYESSCTASITIKQRLSILRFKAHVGFISHMHESTYVLQVSQSRSGCPPCLWHPILTSCTACMYRKYRNHEPVDNLAFEIPCWLQISHISKYMYGRYPHVRQATIW